MSTLASLAPNGVLRAAINTGNRALVQGAGDRVTGISPALARRLAHQIGATLEHVIYPGAGRVVADAHLDRWDVGFLAIDDTRAQKIAFTAPYLTIEATLAVRAAASFQALAEVDRPGTTILTATGSAYDMHLTKSLRHATLCRVDTPADSFAAFRSGQCDAVAGVRASLEACFAADPLVRILPGTLTAVRQAMVLPYRDDPRIAALDGFVAHALADGFIAANAKPLG